MLTAITEFVDQALDKNDKVWAVVRDISKAFDRVWQDDIIQNIKLSLDK